MDEQDDPLIRAIMDAGLYSQHMQPLQQRYQLGQQFMDTPAAHGAQVGNTYQAASWTEHLANAIRQFAGAKMMKDSRTGQQNLTSQLGNDRQAYAQALQGTGGKTVAGDYGEPLQGVGADPQKMNRLAMLGSLSGDPAMQHAAQMAMQERHQTFQDTQLQNTLRHQLALEGQGQQKIGQTERQQKTVFDAFNNPVTTPTHAPSGPRSVLPRSTAAGGGGTPTTPKTPWSPQALDQSAEQYAGTGDYKRMPGRAGAGFDLAVKNRAAELYPEASLATNKSDYIANSNSLRKLQLAQDSLESFEKGMLRNGRLMLESAKGIVDTGSPLFNRPIRSWKLNAGDPRVAAFNAARQVFVQEAGKVLGGAVQGGGLTEGQRHEAEGLMRGDFTLPQMEATLQTLEADAANRKASAAEQLQSVRSRMGGKGGKHAEAPAAPATDTDALRKKYGL